MIEPSELANRFSNEVAHLIRLRDNAGDELGFAADFLNERNGLCSAGFMDI